MNFPKITATLAAVAAITLGGGLFVACGADGDSTRAKDETSSSGDSSGRVQSSSSSAKPASSAAPELPACGDADSYDETKFICIEGKLYSLCGKRAYDPGVKFCVESKGTIYDLCAGKSYDVDEEFCQEGTDEVLEKCGGKTYTREQFCYKESFVANRCGGEAYEYDEEICKDDKQETLTKGMFLDSRNGVFYETVTIGTQTWMAQNLNYDDLVSTPNLEGGSLCHDYKDENCETYGRLYTWAAAMNLDSKYNVITAGDLVQGKHRGICPEGWHIPDDAEWSTLESYVDGLDDVDNNEGYWLKTRHGWNDYDATTGNGIDGVGFSALPSGRKAADFGGMAAGFDQLGSGAVFWSTSEDNNYEAVAHYLGSGSSDLGLRNYRKNDGISVRCLQD